MKFKTNATVLVLKKKKLAFKNKQNVYGLYLTDTFLSLTQNSQNSYHHI